MGQSQRKKKTGQLLIGLVLIALQIGLLRSGWLERFENILLDGFFRMRPYLRTDPSIAYIEIAEDSIQQIGRWPWARHYHAVLTHVLSQWGARAIVFDMVFSEPSEAFDDKALQQAFQESSKVYLPVILEGKIAGNAWIRSLPQFSLASKGLGHINAAPDRDGVLRRISPALTHGEESYPYMGLQVASDLLGTPPEELVGRPRQKLDAQGKLLVNWAGNWEHTFEHYSYLDLLRSFEAVKNGRPPLIPPETFQNKICLIGLTGTGLGDTMATPVEASYPGLGVMANVINAALTGQYIYVVPFYLNAWVLAGVGLLALLIFMPFGLVISVAVGLMLAALWVIFAFILFCKTGLVVSVFHPILEIVSLCIFMPVYAAVTGEKERLRLFQLATRDGLTGLYTIRHIKGVLEEMIANHGKPRKEPIGIILSDVDHFKKVNDTYGHQAGDAVLQHVARILQASVRQPRQEGETDLAGRYGGEEMIAILPKTSAEDAVHVAERIRKSVEAARVSWGGKEIPVTISLGVAQIEPEETAAEAAIGRADKALYQAKENGRNQTRTMLS